MRHDSALAVLSCGPGLPETFHPCLKMLALFLHRCAQRLHLNADGSVLLVGEKVGLMYYITFHSQDSEPLINYFTCIF